MTNTIKVTFGANATCGKPSGLPVHKGGTSKLRKGKPGKRE